MEFQYYLPVNLIFGQGKADLVGEETAKYGRRALVVTGRNSARKTGLLDRIQDSLKKPVSLQWSMTRPVKPAGLRRLSGNGAGPGGEV